MHRMTATRLAAVALLLTGCGTTDSTPSAPTDQSSVTAQGGSHGNYHRRRHHFDVKLYPVCDTLGGPVDTIPTDTTDTLPTDTTTPPTLRSMGGGHDGDHHDQGCRAHNDDDDNDDHDGWADRWDRWWRKGGLIKVRPDFDDTLVVLKTKVRRLEPNTAYVLQAALDTIPDRECTSVDWVTLGAGTAQLSIHTNERGNGYAEFFRTLADVPPGKYDVHFQVIDSATAARVLESRCHRVRTGR